MALVNELRKSNLPMQDYNIPATKSTAQESYAIRSSKKDEIDAIRERK